MLHLRAGIEQRSNCGCKKRVVLHSLLEVNADLFRHPEGPKLLSTWISSGQTPDTARVQPGEANTCFKHEIGGRGSKLDTELRFSVVRCARQILPDRQICDSRATGCGASALKEIRSA